jgi:hypothetical protein
VVAVNGEKLQLQSNASGLTLAFQFGLEPELRLTVRRGGREQSVSVRLD